MVDRKPFPGDKEGVEDEEQGRYPVMPQILPFSRYRGALLVGLALFVVLLGAEWKELRAFSSRVNDLPSLNTPAGVEIGIFAADLPGVRHLVFDDGGVLYATLMRRGMVVSLPDDDGDGRADRVVTILEGRRLPHGLAFAESGGDTWLYVAEEDRVVRIRREGDGLEFGDPEVVLSGIPTGGHVSRTIRARDGRLYLSVGSSCNVCIEEDDLRAAVSRYDLDGKGGEIFARGLRNTVGMEFSPWTGELWGVNNGRDRLGDDRPREELNVIREGRHYGWPFCHEDRVPDPEYGDGMDCGKTEPPLYTFTAHMAPLGMAFYRSGSLPPRYENSLFVAFHGSWDRSVPAGYKVGRVILDGKGGITGSEDFIDGWLGPEGEVAGRPVDLELSPGGDLYLSDDRRGVIYRIWGSSPGGGL